MTAIGAYRRGLRAAIHHLKFQRQWDLIFPLAARLGAVPPPIDVLVPLPLHAARERERGFNQAMLLAQVLAGQWHVPCRPLLTRVRATQPQAMLARDRRQANVADAFALSRRVPAGVMVGLVDDVFTSGATAQAAARVLLEGGAAAVHVIVLARALPGRWPPSGGR